MGWYIKVLKQYAVFSGRARRTEYWMFVLFNSITLFVFGIADTIVMAVCDLQEPVFIFYATYLIAIILPSLALTVRRLHDSGKSGWWTLINLIPVVGLVMMLVMMCANSEKGGNRYGANPKTSTQRPSGNALRQSAAVTLIVAASVWITGWLYMSFPLLLRIPDIGFPFVFTQICDLVRGCMLLALGILLFPGRSSAHLPATEACCRLAPLMAVVAAIPAAVELIFLAGGMAAGMYSFGDTYSVISGIAYSLQNLTFLFFSFVLIRKADRGLMSAAAKALIIVSATAVLIKMMNNTVRITASNIRTPEDILGFYLSCTAFYQIALMTVAGIFLSKNAGRTIAAAQPQGTVARQGSGAEAKRRGDARQKYSVENLQKVATGSTVADIIALFGQPDAKKSAEEIFTPVAGRIPDSEAGKEYWTYVTPYGNFHVEIRNSLTVAVNGLEHVIENSRNNEFCDGKKDVAVHVNPRPANPATTIATAPVTRNYPLYTGSGVCDVCNRPLDGVKTYLVPNSVFYSSHKWREHFRKVNFTFAVTDADIDNMRNRDNSQGSAVCENCIHMFR